MSDRIIGPSGGRRRRRTIVLAVAAVAALGVFIVANALAVHDTGKFQLDGDAFSNTQPGSAPAATDDWDKVCHEADPVACPTGSNTSGATAVSWQDDGPLNGTIFTGGGSKDPQDISNWLWKDEAGGLPDKDNLLHSYAARYSLPDDPDDPQDPNDTVCEAGTSGTGNCELLVFGSDRYDNSGDAQQGFWFFQNEITTGGDPSQGGTKFTGVHENGDLLVISDFSNGGTTSTIKVYQWDNTCLKGVNNPQAGECGDANLRLKASSATANCATVSDGDDFCGIVNPSTKPSPWSFTDKSGSNQFLNGEFYEGGINLSALGLGDECFSSAASETRSSTSTTATLKDFVLGQFGNCNATMTTKVKKASDNLPPSGNILPGEEVYDTATVVGSNAAQTPTGNVTFHLCTITGSNTCATGGTQVGSPVALAETVPGTASADSAQVNTDANPLSPGTYCFRADWPGDTNYVGALTVFGPTDPDECFTVKDTSSITTAQKWLPQDEATVTTAGGTAVSGTVVFTLYTKSGTCVDDPNDPDDTRTFTDNTVATGGKFETNNTNYYTTSQTISWSATFTPTDSNAVASSTTTRCERSDLTIDNSASPFPPAP